MYIIDKSTHIVRKGNLLMVSCPRDSGIPAKPVFHALTAHIYPNTTRYPCPAYGCARKRYEKKNDKTFPTAAARMLLELVCTVKFETRVESQYTGRES